MPRAQGTAVENNFSKGLITEATGLNFPENACTDTDNCVFKFNGSVERRRGFDFEDSSSTKNIDRTNCVIKNYLWRNVSGNGNLTVLVVQVGATIYFYRTDGQSLSTGAVADTVTLVGESGAPSVETVEAQFSDGNGLLFITHPYCNPLYVSYNASTDAVTENTITIKVRDFEGATADVLGVDVRPTSGLSGLNVDHKYNLYNQGWNTTNLTAWDTAQTTMPSNVDVMWRFKDTSDNFSAANTDIARVVAGNTPAPKGHFILTLWNQDRDTAAGTSGVAATTTGYQRPSTSAFFAGRLFFAGINYTGYNSKIYFTQIVERPEQYGFCYQVNDPTAEDYFDLLPSDGGEVKIQDAGTIFKLITVPGGLVVFAANGIWFITGSSGLGFTATDYTVQKIASIYSISDTSFVDVAGFPCWWNAEGIYMLTGQSNGFPSVQSLTDTTIKSFYDEIPLASKKLARGFYHMVEKRVVWLYKHESTEQTTEAYNFDRALIFDVRTGAFYPWTITDSDVRIHAVTVTDATTGNITLDNVIDGSSNNVVDGSGNQLVAFTLAGASTSPTFKYLVSFTNGATYSFTFAETRNTDYLDWFQYDAVGQNYESYITSGYKLRGEGLRKFQSNWISIFSQTDTPVSYYFQSLWDYANTGDTGRWSSKQYVNHPDTDYSNSKRRLKVRGSGIAMQIKISSVESEPFHLIGWSTFDSVNQSP